MYKLCFVCRRNFDVILKFENLALESQQFLKYMKWDYIIPPTVSDEIQFLTFSHSKCLKILLLQQWNHPSHSNEQNMNLLQTYFNQLSENEILELQKLYKIDMNLFGYIDPTEHIIDSLSIV